jgi:putative heme iron utilization protein
MAESEESLGAEIRGLVRGAERAGLATTLAEADGGRPYVSLTLVATGHDASPLLLLSDLADHTKNLAADPRVALLFDGTRGYREPLAGPRATLVGRAERSDDPALEARFVARHPGAAVYAGFADFHLYRVLVERAHLVAGFGKVHWIDGARVLFPAGGAEALAAAEPGIVAHMNGDHAEALDLMARHLLGRPGSGWSLVGIDPEGADLSGEEGLARLPFGETVRDAEEARRALVRLAGEARLRAAGGGAK